MLNPKPACLAAIPSGTSLSLCQLTPSQEKKEVQHVTILISFKVNNSAQPMLFLRMCKKLISPLKIRREKSVGWKTVNSW